tara:strand:+ start:931 stop:1257 length:327 start_codon:yes stop_codon:yes gene_type:complete
MVECGALGCGARIGFYQGDPRKLTEDISELRPTLFAGVPKVFDRFKSNIENGLSQTKGLKGFLVKKGLKSRQKELEKGKIPTGWNFVFKNCKKCCSYSKLFASSTVEL